MNPPRPSPGHKPFASVIVEENTARGPHTPPPPAPSRELTRPGMPAPPANRPKMDSLEVSAETLLAEISVKNAELSAERDARAAADARAQAAESKAGARGPSFSLGSAQWWVLVIGALAVAAPQIREWARPSASAAQIAGLQADAKDIQTSLKKVVDAADAKEVADGKRWTISVAFACSQGLRARGLDCEGAQTYADIQPVPLTGTNKLHGTPQWKATAGWPPVPIPRD